MARNNNLQDLLRDTANAIREKKGITDLINPQDFPEEIASIETGGGLELLPMPSNIISYKSSSDAIELNTNIPNKNFGGTRVFYKKDSIPTFEEIEESTAAYIDGSGRIVVDGLDGNSIYGVYTATMNENGKLQLVDSTGSKRKIVTKVLGNLFDEIYVNGIITSTGQIYISKNGTLFATTSSGIYRYNGGDEFVNVYVSSVSSAYWSESSAGIYAGSSISLFKYDSTADSFKQIGSQRIYYQLETSNGDIYGWSNTLYKYDNGSFVSLGISLGYSSTAHSIYETEYGDLLVFGETKVWILKHGEVEFEEITLPNSIGSSNGNNVISMSDYVFFTGTTRNDSSNYSYVYDGSSVFRLDGQVEGGSATIFKNAIHINKGNGLLVRYDDGLKSYVATLSSTGTFRDYFIANDKLFVNNDRYLYKYDETSNYFTKSYNSGVSASYTKFMLSSELLNGNVLFSFQKLSTSSPKGIIKYDATSDSFSKIYNDGNFWKEIYANGNLHYLFSNTGLIVYDESNDSFQTIASLEEEVTEVVNHLQVGTDIYLYYTVSTAEVYVFNTETLQLSVIDDMFGGKNIGSETRPLLVDNTRHKLYDIKNDIVYDLQGDYTGNVTAINDTNYLSNVPNYLLIARQPID